MNKKQVKKLIRDLEKRVEFHRKNQNDPYGVGNAVIVALCEIIQAIKNATVEER